jgi:histidinol-phosphate aminotransferase
MTVNTSKYLHSIQPYQAGQNIATGIKLSSNENPLGPAPLARDALKEHLASLSRYPNSSAQALRNKLAHKLNIAPDQLIVGNGSDEVLSLIAKAYLEPDQQVCIPKVTFSVYETSALLAGARIIRVPLSNNKLDLTAMAESITKQTKIIYLCNPNNPTGTIYTQEVWQAFLESIPEHILAVVDEAYAEYVSSVQYPDTIADIINGRDNVIVLRTFSKIYGLAGLRVGYGLADASIIAALNKARMPFNVNHLAQVAAAAALDDAGHLKASLDNNMQGKKYLYQELAKMGLKYQPTEANFIYIDLAQPAANICAKLYERGVAIRPLDSFGRPQAIRVTIGTAEQNKRFVENLQKIL